MDEQFKVGDWVEVVDNSGGPFHFKVGDVCQVESIEKYFNDPILRLVGHIGGMFSSRFKKASPPLPDVFQFLYRTSSVVYTATKTGNKYTVTWPECGHSNAVYSVAGSTDSVRAGLWKIIPPANGVDGQNNPLNFTKDMLKPMMRVTTMNGDEWIVVDNVQKSYDDAVVGVRSSSFTTFYDDTAGSEVYDRYIVKEVYGCPSYNQYLFDPSQKGPLIWKRAEQPKAAEPEPSPLQKRLDYLQVHIGAVKENVESLEKEMKELQEEAGNV